MRHVEYFRQWVARLPFTWGMGQSRIHSSLVITLGLIAFVFIVLSFSNRTSVEMRSVAVTLPFVWCLSVAVRVAAQQVALGPYAQDMDSVIGPTGNLSTDYEYLPTGRMFAYALAGQLATLSLVAIGLSVTAATLPAALESVSIGHLLDFRGGWGNEAWATQIMWVNLFIAGLHCLPTVPFDMRAATYAALSRKSVNPQEPAVLNRLAQLDSHLAATAVGVGVALALVAWGGGRESLGWYGALAASIYLFVASRWEASRAEELEQQYCPVPVRIARKDRAHVPPPHARQAGREPASASISAQAATQPAEAPPPRPESTVLDLDEILRKLHREGRQALSESEQEALLLASRNLKEKRGKAPS